MSAGMAQAAGTGRTKDLISTVSQISHALMGEVAKVIIGKEHPHFPHLNFDMVFPATFLSDRFSMSQFPQIDALLSDKDFISSDIPFGLLLLIKFTQASEEKK